MDGWTIKGNIVETFGFIIRVQRFERIVQKFIEQGDIRWLGLKFNQPFMRTFFFSLHKNGCYGIINDFRFGLFADLFQRILGVLYYQFLAKYIDVVFGASRNPYTIW